jgi:hypothetical protein
MSGDIEKMFNVIMSVPSKMATRKDLEALGIVKPNEINIACQNRLENFGAPKKEAKELTGSISGLVGDLKQYIKDNPNDCEKEKMGLIQLESCLVNNHGSFRPVKDGK